MPWGGSARGKKREEAMSIVERSIQSGGGVAGRGESVTD